MYGRFTQVAGDRSWLIIGTAALVYAVTHLVIAHGTQFYHDEWWFICGRSLGDLSSWFRPHNEHFVALHVVGYRLIVEGFGLGSSIPYQLALIGTHLGVVSALFLLVDRHASRAAAVGAALLMLFLGSGSLNLFWGFQIGMIGATALGLWALVLLPNRPWAAALLLTAGVATQGVALFFIAAAGAYLLVQWRVRSTAWLLLPTLVFLAWALTMRDSVISGAIDVDGILRYAVAGIALAVAGTMGLGLVSALVGVVGVAISRPTAWRSALVAASMVGLVAQYLIVATARHELGNAGASHYVYVGSTFVIMMGATLLASARRPWVGPVLLTVALTANVVAFLFVGSRWPAHTEIHNQAGERHPPASACYDEPSFEEIKVRAGVP